MVSIEDFRIATRAQYHGECEGVYKKMLLMVPGERLELSRYHYRRILSPLRLPFRHPGREGRTIIRVFQRRASRDQATHVETMPVGYDSTLFKTRKAAC